MNIKIQGKWRKLRKKTGKMIELGKMIRAKGSREKQRKITLKMFAKALSYLVTLYITKSNY